MFLDQYRLFRVKCYKTQRYQIMIQLKNDLLSRFLYHHQTMKIVRFFKTYFFDSYALKSYSQEGEDMILKRIFENQTTGFYVDVGAHHPKRFSNTYYFYKKGWPKARFSVQKDLNIFSTLVDKTGQGFFR